MSQTNKRSESGKKKPLKDQLYEASHEWPLNGNRVFIPIDTIQSLVSYENVRSTLVKLRRGLSDQQLDSYTEYICSYSKKLFTIFAIIDQLPTLLELLDARITDLDLPFTRIPLVKGNNDGRLYMLGKESHKHCRLSNHGDCHIKPLSSWGMPEIRRLCSDQWAALAPVFEDARGKVIDYELNDNTILPFTSDQEGEAEKVKVGGFSEVWGVQIHRAHQKLLPVVASGAEVRSI